MARTRDWLLLTTAAMALAALLKWPCLHHGWDGFQYASLCYSDIQALYHVRGIADGVIPYVEGFSEYPVLTGAWTWLAGSLTADIEQYVWLNMLFLGSCAVLTTWLLLRSGGGARIWMWVLAPSLVLSVFVNFDVFAVALTAAGVFLFRERRLDASAILFGLGAAAKLYPGFLVPVFAGAVAREVGWGKGLRFGVVAFAAWALVQLPFLLASPEGWYGTYSFHAGRAQEWETLWMVLAQIGAERDWAWVGRVVAPDPMAAVSRVALVLAVGLASFATLRGLLGPIEGSLLVLGVFFLTSPVFNMQYVLWLLPFLVLSDVPVRLVAVLFFGDIVVHMTKFHLLMHLGTEAYDQHFVVFGLGVLIRAVAFAGLLVLTLPAATAPLRARSARSSGAEPE